MTALHKIFLLQDLLLLEVYLKSSLVVKYNLAVGTQQLFFYALLKVNFLLLLSFQKIMVKFELMFCH
jgi:hypothetical protein